MSDDLIYKTKKPKVSKIIKRVIFFVLESVIAVALGYAVITFATEKTVMVGGSMEKTLFNDDVLIINKLAYRKEGPKRNDVIVFNQSRNEHSFYNVKRVIGIPGDTVEIMNGKVYINGAEFSEKVNVESMRLSGIADDPVTLLENEYFVLGDNRNLSEDSRYSNIGLVSVNDIIGKAVLRISPKVALIDKLNLNPEHKIE